MKVTTSWDDGDVLDLKMAEVLERHGATGTFYITKDYRRNRLSEDEIRAIAQRHEVGAHTLTHPNLRLLTREQVREEVAGGKQWLESVVGKEVPMFCYPFGFYDKEAAEVVQEAGFRAARTTALKVKDDFHMPVSIQVYPLPFRRLPGGGLYWRKLLQPIVQRALPLSAAGVKWYQMRSFYAAATALIDEAARTGRPVHIWGHSWEVEQYGMWKDLERVLAHAKKKGATFVTNSGSLA